MQAVAVPMAVIVVLAAVVMAYVPLVRLGRDTPGERLSTAFARATDRVRPPASRRERPRTATPAG